MADGATATATATDDGISNGRNKNKSQEIVLYRDATGLLFSSFLFFSFFFFLFFFSSSSSLHDHLIVITDPASSQPVRCTTHHEPAHSRWDHLIGRRLLCPGHCNSDKELVSVDVVGVYVVAAGSACEILVKQT